MKIAQANTIFLHGIAGTGMRGLAWILYKQGKKVRGTDTNLPDDLSDGFAVAPEHEAQHLLDGVDVYIHTDAVQPSHDVYRAAQERSIAVMPYQEAVGSLTYGFTTIAVAGTHGKSSTTAFLAHIAIEAGLDPTVLVGAAVSGWEGKHARFGESSLFIVEADEYRNHYHTLAPMHGIITSIDYDHPDFFASFPDVIASFEGFIARISTEGTVIVPTSLQEQRAITLPASTIPVLPLDAAPLPGEHMKTNAALAVAAAEQIGVSPKDAIAHLHSFPGLSRRFETIGMVSNKPVISDYAHHPAEIAATIQAARATFSGQRIAIIFEAHTAERLITFTKDFVTSLRAADGVLVYPPFVPKGRGAESQQASNELEKELSASGHLVAASEDLDTYLPQLAKQYDVILACTAGNLDFALRKAVKKG